MQIGNYTIGLNQPLLLMAGPCVVESEQLVFDVAGQLKEMTRALKIPFVFKASYDKANRSSHTSFRGLGIDKSLAILAKVRRDLDVMVMTDVHEDSPLDEVAEVADVLQTPAFLSRQTNFMQNVARQMKPMNIKKGQFMAPQDMQRVVEKVRAVGNQLAMVCERGVCFGYNNLISDMRSLVIMRETKCPVIFDATHSVQLPGAKGQSSGGQRQFIPALARAATATGIAGLFMETHPEPDKALSDGPNSWPLADMKYLLEQLQSIDRVVKQTQAFALETI